MSTYEDVSKSAWGSLIFLLSIPRMYVGKSASLSMNHVTYGLKHTDFIRNLATLGATITVLSVVIGAFTQQTIETVSCQKPRPNAQAFIPVAQASTRAFRNGQYFGADDGSHDTDAGLRASLIAGLAGLRSPNSLMPTCSSGNCTFPAKYASAGLSTECIDISSLITQSGAKSWSTNGYENDVAPHSNTTYSLPNGQTITYDLYDFKYTRWDTMIAAATGGKLVATFGGLARQGGLDLEKVTMTEFQK